MTCPSCGSQRVYASRLRSRFDTLRQRLTDRHPYRCHDCGWRVWLDAVPRDDGDVHPDDLRLARGTTPVSPADLDPLDPAAREADPVSDVELDPLDPDDRT